MKPICIGCGQLMKIDRTGARLAECRTPIMPDDSEETRLSKIRCIWAADIFVCQQCGTRVASQFGAAPLVEEFEKNAIRIVIDRALSGYLFYFVGDK